MSSTSQLPFPDFHPEVNSVSRSLYESGHFTHALKEASIRLEECCKQILKEKIWLSKWDRGHTIMTKLFCEKDWKVLFPIVNMWLEDSSDKQQWYYFLYSGFVAAIRNSVQHSTELLDDIEALYGLNMVSYLFYKLDRAKEMNAIPETIEQEPPQTTQTNDTIESSIISLLLSDSHIQAAKQIDDPWIAKLEIKKIATETMVMSIDTIWPEIYNYYDTHEEQIILSLLSSLYDHN